MAKASGQTSGKGSRSNTKMPPTQPNSAAKGKGKQPSTATKGSKGAPGSGVSKSASPFAKNAGKGRKK